MDNYSKTEKGRSELTTPSGELNPKQRRILILCNGELSNAELARAVGMDNADEMILALAVSGFIAGGHVDSQATSNEEIIKPASARSAKEFTQAKNFMVNTISHYHGQYGHLSLKSDINAADSVEKLRAFYPGWCDSMGKIKQLPKLKKELLKVL